MQFRLISRIAHSKKSLERIASNQANMHDMQPLKDLYTLLFAVILFNELANWHFDIFITETEIFETMAMSARLYTNFRINWNMLNICGTRIPYPPPSKEFNFQVSKVQFKRLINYLWSVSELSSREVTTFRNLKYLYFRQ